MKLRRPLPIAMVLVGLIASLASPASAMPTQPIRPEEGQVERLYEAVFDRAPDPAGFAYWFRLRSTSTSLESIAGEFITSPEFAAVAGAPTDAEFVVRLYRNVLDREPDADGLQYWQRSMASGMSRVRLLVLFSESPEFAVATGTTLDPLPPFRSTSAPLDAAALGATWRPGCPVSPAELVRITVSTVDFAGSPAVGELIVNRSAAEPITVIFEHLYEQRYPIERMAPISAFDGNDVASMEANNSSAFNCRAVTAGTGWSRHAYGLAIDLNPRQNPYVRGSIVLPANGAPAQDRTMHHPAMIRDGDIVVQAFAESGWRWGGNYASFTDWQHFER